MISRFLVISGMVCWMIAFTGQKAFSQDAVSWVPSPEPSPILDIGIRINKTPSLYLENGFSANYSHPNIHFNRMYFGASIFSSRLGSAMGSNALKQDNYFLFASWYFRDAKKNRPFLRLNTGYFFSDYESELFDDLDNSSIVLAPEAGFSYKSLLLLKYSLSIGYHLTSGDGVKGPGTLYPIFIQTTLSWNILAKR